jgi:hypothetical protein
MCLEKIGDEKIAEKDIICYKVLVRKRRNISYVTPFQEYTIIIGQEYHSPLAIRYGDTIDIALHSFKTLRGVKSFINEIEKRDHDNWCVCEGEYFPVKCSISKESIYYEGEFGSKGRYWKGYASDKLKYIEILK